jgi:hypothetical protein
VPLCLLAKDGLGGALTRLRTCDLLGHSFGE